MEKKTNQTNQKGRLEDANELCISRGKRLTPIRSKVLNIFLEQNRSLKAYEILGLIQTVHPGAKPATVYRALEFLEQEAFIHRIDTINAWTLSQNWHGNSHDLLLVCISCGKVHELSAPSFTKQLTKHVAQTDFSLSHRQPEIRAICSDCKNKAR